MTQTQTEATEKRENLETALQAKLEEWLKALDYELVALELTTTGRRTLRVFIDRPSQEPKEISKISLEDCIAVSKAINEPLDLLPELQKHWLLN